MAWKAAVVRKITLGCLSLLATPAVAGEWQPIEAMPGLEYLPESAHRTDDHVYFVHRNVPRDGGPNFVIADEVDCKNQALRISWDDGTLGNVKGRYGKVQDRYAPAESRPAESDKVFYDWACKLPLQPECLINVRAEPHGALTQIDIGSVTRIGVTATLWMRHDYPAIGFDPPWKREFVELNCDA